MKRVYLVLLTIAYSLTIMAMQPSKLRYDRKATSALKLLMAEYDFKGPFNTDRIKELILQGADPNITAQGYTILSFAVTRDAELIPFLIAHGANIQRSALELAIIGKKLRAVELLIMHGVNIHAKNSREQTPLFSAVLQGDPEIIKLLLDHGAAPDIEVPDITGITPIAFVRRMRNESLVKLLESYKKQKIK